jgi:glycosyltransferase involved in cell wall biosynthesis
VTTVADPITGKCAHCPFLDEKDRCCPALTLPHPTYCEQVDPDDPRHQPGRFEALRRRVAGQPALVAVPAGPRLPDLPSPDRVADQVRLLARMRTCVHWEKRTDCGCGVNRCNLGKGHDGLVNYADCLACIEEYDAVFSPSPSPYDSPPDHSPMPRPSFPVGAPASDDPPFDPTRRPPPVAVVIPCHDYGCYLAEAIESALAQRPAPAEILVVDDASTDDTPLVATRYADRGVRYLKVGHCDVYLTRRWGLLNTTAEYVCFLDADDMLGPGYLAGAAALLESDRRIGVAYSDADCFGDFTGRSNHPSVLDPMKLEVDNCIHAGAVVRRTALLDSGAFEGPSPPLDSHADWYVWRRVTEAGWGAAKQDALYRYRQHGPTMLRKALSRPYYDQAALNLTDVTIFTPLSGRVWAWEDYLEWLKDQDWPREQTRLMLLDTSRDRLFAKEVGGEAAHLTGLGFSDFRWREMIVGPVGLADLPRRETVDAVRLACRRIYAAMARMVETPYVLVVEDDVIPPPGVIDGLLRSMDRDVAMVAAPYRSRDDPGAFLCWHDDLRHLGDPAPLGVVEVGGSGFGCTLIRRCVLRGEMFVPGPGEAPEYDVAFGQRLRKAGWRILADFALPAEHRSLPG